jgi:hypothetical protein
MIVHPDGFSIYNNNGRHKLLKKSVPLYIKKKCEYINVTHKVAQAFKLRAFQGCLSKPVQVATSFET